MSSTESTFQQIRDGFLRFAKNHYDQIEKLPDRDLEELLHRAEELLNAEDFSMRVAAEIVRAGARLEMDLRTMWKG